MELNTQCLSARLPQFLMECGRTHAVQNNAIVQSDQSDFLGALHKMTAAAFGSKVAVRQAPTYTPQTQGSVEAIHKTLMGHDGTNPSTQRKLKQLWCPFRKLKPRHAMDGEACSVLAERWPSSQTATQAIGGNGTKNAKHQPVSLVKPFLTLHPQKKKSKLEPKFFEANVLGIMQAK